MNNGLIFPFWNLLMQNEFYAGGVRCINPRSGSIGRVWLMNKLIVASGLNWYFFLSRLDLGSINACETNDENKR